MHKSKSAPGPHYIFREILKRRSSSISTFLLILLGDDTTQHLKRSYVIISAVFNGLFTLLKSLFLQNCEASDKTKCAEFELYPCNRSKLLHNKGCT